MYVCATSTVLSGVRPLRFGLSKIDVKLERLPIPMTATLRPPVLRTVKGRVTVPTRPKFGMSCVVWSNL